jgi:hypothetical protein
MRAIRDVAASVALLLWRCTNRLADAAERRPRLHVAGLWWWHHGVSAGSFGAGCSVAVALGGAGPVRLTKIVITVCVVLFAGEAAASIHAVAFSGNLHGGAGCPLCDVDPDRGEGGPDDGPQPDLDYLRPLAHIPGLPEPGEGYRLLAWALERAEKNEPWSGLSRCPKVISQIDPAHCFCQSAPERLTSSSGEARAVASTVCRKSSNGVSPRTWSSPQ